MGWLWLAIIGGLTFLALWRLGVSRELAWVSGAALMLGGAGYAWQQNAFMPGHPVTADAEAIEVDPGLAAFRVGIMPGVADDQAVLATADDRLRAGDSTGAAQGIMDAISRRPTDPALWAGLGSVISAHDGGQMSPAALLAFRHSAALAPNDPGPPFFLGLAYVRAGQLDAAKAAWLQSLALSPRDAPYRVQIAERLVVIDRFRAMDPGGAAPLPRRTGG